MADEMTGEMVESLSFSRFGFRIRSHLLEFYGLCATCQECAPEDSPESVEDFRVGRSLPRLKGKSSAEFWAFAKRTDFL